MLGKAMLLPLALDAADYSPAVNCIPLQDFEVGAQLFVDGPAMMARYGELLKQWPQAERSMAIRCLERLAKTGRVVRINGAAGNVIDSCADCARCVRLPGIVPLDVVLCSHRCSSNYRGTVDAAALVEPSNYSTSAFRTWIVESESYVFAHGEVTAEEFVDRVVGPIFDYAKRVTIYDRMIGRSLVEAVGQTRQIKASYSESIEWLIQAYATRGRRGDKTVKLVTGLDMRTVNTGEVDSLVEALERFCGRMERTYSITVRADIKAEREERTTGPQVELRHDRFLITDQAGLLIGRGFDLLLAGSRRQPIGQRPLRDFAVARLRNTTAIETELLRLRSLGSVNEPA